MVWLIKDTLKPQINMEDFWHLKNQIFIKYLFSQKVLSEIHDSLQCQYSFMARNIALQVQAFAPILHS